MSKAKKLNDASGLTILEDGTRVFIRDAFLFGDVRSRMGRIRGFHVSLENWVLGEPELEYHVQVGQNLHWVSATRIEGFLMGI